MSQEMIIKGRKCILYHPLNKIDNKKMPVILINGDNLTFNILQKNKLLPRERCFSVLILSDKRLDDYTPWPSKALCDRFPDFGGKADDYISWLGNDLIPELEKSVFATSEELILGASGQSISALFLLYLSTKAPYLFKCCSCISPSLWYPEFIEYFRSSVNQEGIKEWLISCGNNEGRDCEDIKKLTVPYTKEVIRLLKENGHNVEEYHDEGNHHEQIKERFEKALAYLENKLISYL